MVNITGQVTDLNRTHHMLEGILQGIGADNVFTLNEAVGLRQWLDLHLNFAELSPFSELLELTEEAIAAGKVEPEVEKEVLLFCQKFTTADGLADSASKNIRVLHGLMQGISIDGVISEAEAGFLQRWVECYAPAANVFPYSDLLELLTRILADGYIDPKEHRELMAFCRNFSERESADQNLDPTIGNRGVWMQNEAPVLESIDNVCQLDAAIIIPGRSFCFTGKMKHGTRTELSERVKLCRGVVAKNVTLDLDYLVIGADSNPCWMYSTYGRKIEKAIFCNKEKNSQIIIIHENNFMTELETQESTAVQMTEGT